MEISGLNPLSILTEVKLYGEKGSGTIYLEWLLQNNLKIELMNDIELGVKTRIAPKMDEIERFGKENILFVFLVKNPYSWLLTLHRKPHNGLEGLKKLSLSDFLKYPYGDYLNPIDLWNKKVQSYVSLMGEGIKHKLVHYENLLVYPQDELQAIAEEFDVAKKFSWFTDNARTICNSKGTTKQEFHVDYYKEERWKRELRSKHLDIINAELDHGLLAKVGYEVLS